MPSWPATASAASHRSKPEPDRQGVWAEPFHPRQLPCPGDFRHQRRKDGEKDFRNPRHRHRASRAAQLAGHRLAPWLGHLMVSRQETARPLLTPGEVMQLPPEDAVVMVSSVAPIRAKKLRYYVDANFKDRVLPPPVLAVGRYADAPPARPDDWSGSDPGRTYGADLGIRRWSGGTDDGGPRRQLELSKPSPTSPSWTRVRTTWSCSMTTTWRSRFPASSTRPCSARPGWLLSTPTTESTYEPIPPQSFHPARARQAPG